MVRDARHGLSRGGLGDDVVLASQEVVDRCKADVPEADGNVDLVVDATELAMSLSSTLLHFVTTRILSRKWHAFSLTWSTVCDLKMTMSLWRFGSW